MINTIKHLKEAVDFYCENYGGSTPVKPIDIITVIGRGTPPGGRVEIREAPEVHPKIAPPLIVKNFCEDELKSYHKRATAETLKFLQDSIPTAMESYADAISLISNLESRLNNIVNPN